jgi:hypothetical protein
MKVYVGSAQGTALYLGQQDFVGEGGEGRVYRRGTHAYKVYHDPARMIPAGKIAELQEISDPRVVKPEGLLYGESPSPTPVGYVMPFLRGCRPLCELFTRTFREEQGLDASRILALVCRFQDLIHAIHRAQVLVVDLNEMNFLVGPGLDEVYAIDADSYRTPSYPATAVMPSVRDWTVQGHGHNPGSDWFSFACVAFQLFTGVHPYKGRHPTVRGLDERMQQRISVFDPAVTVPRVAYPVSTIPAGYRAWFEAVLQRGARLPPPVDPGHFSPVVSTVPAMPTSEGLETKLVYLLPSTILGVFTDAEQAVLWTAAGVYLGAKGPGKPGPMGAMQVIAAPGIRAVQVRAGAGAVLAVGLHDGQLQVSPAGLVSLTIDATAVSAHDGRVYAQTGARVIELFQAGVLSQVQTRVVTAVLPHATQLFPGVVVQNVLGSVFTSVFPASGVAPQVRMPELDGKRVVDAAYSSRVLMAVTVNSQGRYDRHVFVFSEDHQVYQALPPVEAVTQTGVNFTVSDGGVCAALHEDVFEVWAVNNPSKKKQLDGAVISGGRLVRYHGRVAFIRGAELHAVWMK